MRITNVNISTLADRPEYVGRIYEIAKATTPRYLFQDLVANALLPRIAETFPGYCVIATSENGKLLARGRSVPFTFGIAGREELPDGGVNRVLVWAFEDLAVSRSPTAACAVEISVRPDLRGMGISHAILAAMLEAVARHGLKVLVAPVRPTAKHAEPHLPMAEYVRRTREDGLPADPWLRVHVRAGGRLCGVAPASSVVAGSLAEWREWTGLPFDRDGDVDVPEALTPVVCDVVHDYAVYVEPNVWVWHDLSGLSS